MTFTTIYVLRQRTLQCIQGCSVVFSHFAKFFWRQARHLLELRGEVCRRAVSKPIGYFACGKLTVAQQFLGIFNAMQNREPLDGYASHFGEQFAQCTIVLVKTVRQIIGQLMTLLIHPHPLLYGYAYLLHQLRAWIVKQFETYVVQFPRNRKTLSVGEFFLYLCIAQTYRLHRQTF